MANIKILPIKVIDEYFPATVSDAVKIPGSKENIKEYTDREISNLKEYCDNYLTQKIYNHLGSTKKINVVDDLGLIPTKYTAEVRASNAEKIKNALLENETNFNGDIIFFFPQGEYHMDPIEFDANVDTLANGTSISTLKLFVTLVGETNGADDYSIKTSQSESRVSRIITYGNFIVRKNSTGTGNPVSALTVIAQNLFFGQNDVNTINHDNAPHGTCFGTVGDNYNNGEHNFYIKKCNFVGFGRAIYSPGYSCGGTRFEDAFFGLCKYAVMIMSASHCITFQRCNVNSCYRGITLFYGGDYCEVKHTHVDSSFHPSFQQFLDEDPRCYFLYSGGGTTVDGLYMEQYTGVDSGYMEIPETYFVFDYEGNNYASRHGKLEIKNITIGTPGGKGKFFKGATFQGMGSLKIDGVPLNETPLRQPSSHAGLWKNGCVNFINCSPGIDSIKKWFEIYDGLDRASGYVFDYRDLYGDGVAFTKHPRRGFKGSYIYDKEGKFISKHPMYGFKYGSNTYKGTLVYEKIEIDPNVKYYKGTRLTRDTSGGNNYEPTGNYGCHLKGRVTIKNITNENANFTIFLFLHPKTSESPIQFIDLIDVNSSTINKELTANFELTINALDYDNMSFGYRVNYDKSLSDESSINNDINLKMPHGEDEAKIIYEYETEWDSDDIFNYREVDGIYLSSETLNMTEGGETQTLEVTYKPTYTTQKGVDWTTSNDKVATVINGVVTAVGAGECDITATCNKNDYAYSATCKVTVLGENSKDIIKDGLVFRLDGKNTDSNAYLTDTVNGVTCNILNTGYTKTNNGVVIPKDSTACIEIPASDTNYGITNEMTLEVQTISPGKLSVFGKDANSSIAADNVFKVYINYMNTSDVSSYKKNQNYDVANANKFITGLHRISVTVSTDGNVLTYVDGELYNGFNDTIITDYKDLSTLFKSINYSLKDTMYSGKSTDESTFVSMTLYNRALSADEIKQNYDSDIFLENIQVLP